MNLKSDHLCPLCGKPNKCALAETGKPDTPCWCHTVTVNPSAIALAHQQQNHDACLCKQCAGAINLHLETRQITLTLYATRHCHLCEEAEEIMRKAGLAANIVDIVSDENLLAKYATRIPVLLRSDNNAELGWPFDREAVSQFLGLP